MEVKEFKTKLKETKCILEKAKVEYKKERTALSNKVLESYNIHVGDEIIYNNRKTKRDPGVGDSHGENFLFFREHGKKCRHDGNRSNG